MKIKLGVVFGGESVEHEVSIISAVQAMNKMDQEKYDIIPIYITKDGEWYTGNMLMDVEVYGDLDLIKKYARVFPLYEQLLKKININETIKFEMFERALIVINNSKNGL